MWMCIWVGYHCYRATNTFLISGTIKFRSHCSSSSRDQHSSLGQRAVPSPWPVSLWGGAVPSPALQCMPKRAKQNMKKKKHSRGSRSIWKAIAKLPKWASDLRKQLGVGRPKQIQENLEHLNTISRAIRNDLVNTVEKIKKEESIDDIIRDMNDCMGINSQSSASSSSEILRTCENHRKAEARQS